MPPVHSYRLMSSRSVCRTDWIQASRLVHSPPAADLVTAHGSIATRVSQGLERAGHVAAGRLAEGAVFAAAGAERDARAEDDEQESGSVTRVVLLHAATAVQSRRQGRPHGTGAADNERTARAGGETADGLGEPGHGSLECASPCRYGWNMPDILAQASLPELALLMLAFFGGLTVVNVPIGFALERLLRHRRIYDVPLAEGQYRFEFVGNLVFLAVTVTTFTAVLSSGLVRFGETSLLRDGLTFFVMLAGFQVFYDWLHRPCTTGRSCVFTGGTIAPT